MERTILWEVTDDVRQTVPKKYDKTKEMVDQDIEILQEWMKTQEYLPEILEGEVIRNFLHYNKGSIERTKKSIDFYYTLRSKIPELAYNVNPKYAHMKRIMDIIYVINLPKLTEDMCRVAILKVRDPSLMEELDFQFLYGHVINTGEIRMREDYCSSNVFILDLSHFNSEIIRRHPLHLMIKLAMVYKEVVKIPVKAIYCLKAPRLINWILAIVKMAFSEKMVSRIQFLDHFEDLKDYIPEEILPVDYGGKEKSLEELNEMLKKRFEECKELFDRLEKLRVDESLRPPELKNDELLGTHGSFKMLTID